MDTIDNPLTPTNQSDVSFMQTAIRYGLIGSAISIVVNLVSQLLGWADGTNMGMAMLVGVIGMAVYVIAQVMGVRHHRDNELGGYISFGRAFLVCLVIAMIMAILGAIFNYIYITFIDPEAMERAMEVVREQYEEMGMDEEAIENAMSMVDMTKSPLIQIGGAIFGGAIMGGITGLIIGAVMKKEAPLA